MKRHASARGRALAVLGGIGCGVFFALGCGGGHLSAKSADPDARPTAIEHEPCKPNASSTNVDVNGDGKPDLISVMSGGHEVCRIVDLNFDGKPDRYTYFDGNGKPRRIESDYDRDGRIDEITYLKDGVIVRKDRAMGLAGKLDTWDIYENGKMVRQERDHDGDGRVDQWWTFPPDKPDCPVVAEDRDGDGRPDVGAVLDMCSTDDGPANILAATASASAAAPISSAKAQVVGGAVGVAASALSAPSAPPAPSAAPATSGGK